MPSYNHIIPSCPQDVSDNIDKAHSPESEDFVRQHPNEEQGQKQPEVTVLLGYPLKGASFKAVFRDCRPFFLSTPIITLPFDLLQNDFDRDQILDCPDIHRIVICQPSHRYIKSDRDRDARVYFFAKLFKSFNWLQTLVLPVEFKTDPGILYALQHHENLVQLELAMPTTYSMKERDIDPISIALSLGLHVLQQLQDVTIPQTLISIPVLDVLSKMENLNYLKIKNTRSDSRGGDLFVEMISEFNISSAHSFYPLRRLDIDINNTRPENRNILMRRFPSIEYA
ncbi:hypothetical protein BDN70DRAFT_899694 [Pholiota conissans]|uniref:Uncharacterized protein n=1 Tax=Pholiota conissans TaxID=109636 RepID=A0A9P6CP40_9AGAR|nr:hypothetical protein BDN70DRAFT_899694 [Pholiota conissans]